jgi:hypothetical protein
MSIDLSKEVKSHIWDKVEQPIWEKARFTTENFIQYPFRDKLYRNLQPRFFKKLKDFLEDYLYCNWGGGL